MASHDKKKWIKSQFEQRMTQAGLPLWLSALCSIAISLKRIADNGK